MSIQQWKVTEPYVATKCKLGEGVYYVPERNELRFLDINSSKLYIIDLNKGPDSLKEIDTGMPVGVTVDIEGVDSSEIVLAGAKDGVTKFNLKTQKHDYVVKYWSGAGAEEKTKRMRSNDGAVDTAGRFWVEAFDDPEIGDPSDEGVLFRMDPDGTLQTMYEKIVIPNGITWNEQDNTMHLTDTTEKRILSFAYHSKTGDISDKKIFYDHSKSGLPGNPDGHTQDSEGNLWQALYGGSRVIRVTPEGKVTGEVLLPTRNITCCVFAGTDLFVTSAVEEDPENNPESAKYAGNLFKVNVGVGGAPRHKARLS
ncbi:rRNA-processing protein cgr1 [Lithohypha guttulata]|uniref:rRNA-processing protein cgr1 n=1 Tax=Lithohypha guttulata TaxID=1690604 RepID=UPI002DDE8041|nr:rRNA-processing protein cgr1 [Lithohypha guttulata]